MKIRFGYVAHAISLWDCSPSKTITFTNWKKLKKEERITRLIEIAKQNIRNTKRMIMYNMAHEIELYRLSSSIVPLATHPEVEWDYQMDLKDDFHSLGEIIKENKLRVSLHPNQFTLFTSERDEVTQNAIQDMIYHYHIFSMMDIVNTSLINIHVGGAYGDKDSAVERFHKNIQLLPSYIKDRMTLENDDKTYTATETLRVCKRENIPLLFDYHHHMANLSDEPLLELLKGTFSTWNHFGIIPKVHLSSPKSPNEFRHHADYVDVEFILPFLKVAKELETDFDVMIEAKGKDRALLKLVEDISKVRGIKRVGGATIQWK